MKQTSIFRKYGMISLGLIIGTCLLILVYNQKDMDEYSRKVQYVDPIQDDYVSGENFTAYVTIKDVVRNQRYAIAQAVAGYQFPPATNLSNFTMATGGQPVRTVIATTWRSGSTFLGDVFNALPGNFYHYEPLLDYGIVQVRGPPYSDTALRVLKKLLRCDYHGLDKYLEYGQSHIYLFTHNRRLWSQCEQYPQFCWQPDFLSAICREFPFQSMKTVRLRLKLAEELLNDPQLNVRVLLLVRDPRGTLQSRKHRDWCPGEPDCEQPNLLCGDMVADYSAAIRLQELYADRFRAIRYEDLAAQPAEHIAQLFQQLGLDFHANVREFLESHTKHDAGGVSSTFRNSASAPYHWRADLNYAEVQYIQERCERAMNLWGYVAARNESHLKEFNPITSYVVE